jgi:hypothetical protein
MRPEVDHDLIAQALRFFAEMKMNNPNNWEKREGDYWEEDENGVMWLKHKNGTTVLMMSKADYEEMKEYKGT